MNCPSLILCDHVYLNRTDGKLYILGALNVVIVPSLPYTREMWVQFSVTGGQGQYVFEVQVEHEQTTSSVGFIRSTPRTYKAPNIVGEENFPIEISFHLDGRYWVTLLANDEKIARRSLDVLVEGKDAPGLLRVTEG